MFKIINFEILTPFFPTMMSKKQLVKFGEVNSIFSTMMLNDNLWDVGTLTQNFYLKQIVSFKVFLQNFFQL